MKIRSLTLGALAVVAIATGYSYAQPGGGPPGGRGAFFERMMAALPVLVALDADKDKTISAEEIAGASAALLTLDKDGSGALEMEELQPDFSQMRRGRGGRPRGDGDAPRRPPIEE